MKKITLVALTSIALLTGCGDSSDDLDSYYANQGQSPATQTSYGAEEQAELKTAVSQLQAEDPSIQDAYYGEQDGQRVLHVTREADDGSIMDIVVPFMAGWMISDAVVTMTMVVTM